MRKITLILLGLYFSGTLTGQTRNEVWSKDIDYLKTELSSKHVNLFFETSKEVFFNRLDSIKKLIDIKTDIELAIEMQLAVAEMGDDHTAIDFYSKIKDKGKLPIFTYWYSDGLYVRQTLSQYQPILGTKLTAINHIPIDSVISKSSTLISRTNEAIIKHRIPNIINLVGVLEYFNIIQSDSTLCSFTSIYGEEINIWIKAINNNTPKEEIKFIPENYMQESEDKNGMFWSKVLADDKTVYARYNVCWSKELEKKFGDKKKAKNLPSFENFKTELIKQLNQPEIERLIFDVRYNPGGSSPQGTELVKEIEKMEKINKKGNLFVLIGRRTYSSAVINAMDFKKNTNAIFIGEPTSGKPNHFGEVRSFLLPNSGIKVYYSTKYFEYSDTDENSIYPDILVELSYEVSRKGIDPVIERAKDYKD